MSFLQLLFFEFEEVAAIGRDERVEEAPNASLEPCGVAGINTVVVSAAERTKPQGRKDVSLCHQSGHACGNGLKFGVDVVGQIVIDAVEILPFFQITPM